MSMKKSNTVYVNIAGGGIGCTQKLHFITDDFVLTVGDKQYRFQVNGNGQLILCCINGMDADFGVHMGYKSVFLTGTTTPVEPRDLSFDDKHKEFATAMISALGGCGKSDDCMFMRNNPGGRTDKTCSCTGEDLMRVFKRGEQCPFKSADVVTFDNDPEEPPIRN